MMTPEVFRLEQLFRLAEWFADPIRVVPLNDRVQTSTVGTIEGADTAWARAVIRRYRRRVGVLVAQFEADLDPNIEHEPDVSPRCRKRGCSWSGRRQRDASYCAGCGSEL